MIAKYKRTARGFQELGLGVLEPLALAIPEIGVSTRVNTDSTTNEEKMMTNAKLASRPQRDSNPCYQRERLVS